MKRIISLSLIAILIIISGCLQSQEKTPSVPDINKTNATNITNHTTKPSLITVGPCSSTNRREVDLCLLDNSLCTDIANVSLRDECYYNNLNCSKILDINMKKECETKVRLMECEKADDANLCKALATADPLQCGANVGCIMGYVQHYNNTAACDQLTGYTKSACRAVAKGDYNVCYEEQQYDALKKECLKMFAKYTGRDGDICKGISLMEYREDCYKGVAEMSRNYSNCLLISTYNLHRDCIQNVAILNADYTICYNIRLAYDEATNKEDQNYCITQTAMRNYKPQFCQNLTKAGYKTACFANSIVNGMVKSEDCEQIDKSRFPEWSAECYKRAALPAK